MNSEQLKEYSKTNICIKGDFNGFYMPFKKDKQILIFENENRNTKKHLENRKLLFIDEIQTPKNKKIILMKYENKSAYYSAIKYLQKNKFKRRLTNQDYYFNEKRKYYEYIRRNYYEN